MKLGRITGNLAKIVETVDHADTQVMRTVPELGFVAQ